MSVLLSRTAGRLYWGARYMERAEDTARIVRAYNDLVVDYPSQELLSWKPLVAIHGSDEEVTVDWDHDPAGEKAVLSHILSDHDNPSSIVSSVKVARENLRTTREVMPREAWQAVNQLSQYVDATAGAAVERQLRDRFLLRIIEISRRLDGVLESTMSRGRAYSMLRLGRLVERADMTTRVLGVAAAGILVGEMNDVEVVNEQVRWMSVLRSVSALQMYQRSDHGPIDGLHVVRFLLYWEMFPRSVQGCLDEIATVLAGMPRCTPLLGVLEDTRAVLSGADPSNTEADTLDRSMEKVQHAIANLSDAITSTYADDT